MIYIRIMRDQVYSINLQKKEFTINKSLRMIAIKTLIDQQLATGEVVIVFDPINEQGVEYLIEMATPSLRSLIIQGAFTGSLALMSLHRGAFNNLITVELKNNEIYNQGCKYLSKCSFNSMRKLSLASNFIEGAGVMHLQKASWQTVMSFSLYNNVVGDQGMKLIGKCQFKRLESLCMSKCDITTNGITSLMGFQFPLKRLYISMPRDAYFQSVKTLDSSIEKKIPKLIDSNFK